VRDQTITFRQLLHPISVEDFFAQLHGKRAVHIPGNDDKLANVFSWDEFNRLLNQATLWSDQSTKMVLNGRSLDSSEFCTAGRNREGSQAMMLDPGRVTKHLRGGATLILDLVERLSPGISAVTTALEIAMGGPAVCNAYCSWSAQQGFPSHFDSTDVFALHIAGQKTWRIYEGRFLHPVEGTEFHYLALPPAQHERARGKVLKQVVMNPGDVLYIPRGQYHDATATSDASLHLSFGIERPTGLHFMKLLSRSLPDDPLFRKELPHVDDVEGYQVHLRKLADRLHEMIATSDTAKQTRRELQRLAYRNSLRHFSLPTRDMVESYRVRKHHTKLTEQRNHHVLQTAHAQATLSVDQAKIVEWVLERDWFSADRLAEVFNGYASSTLTDMLTQLAEMSVIERV
jgi:ribosomal protein L16 Arg81 hydroxylase